MTVLATSLLCAINLVGVTGSDLRARAFFDANNVTVGDPLVLTVDFIGTADFRNLHPPALAKAVGRADWKVDDASAKTDTFRDARRLTYRVRPMREGVLWFPPLDFAYVGPDGAPRQVRSNTIPVHAKGGVQVVVAEMPDDRERMPQPPALGKAPEGLSEDDLFRWRKAMSCPTADGFAAFDGPEARLNEAACALREGNWARAERIYRRLEWRIGQTPEIEKGLLAALALRQERPDVELPVWRQVFRPVLRFGWRGRVGMAVGGLAALLLLYWLVGRGIRAVACLALVLCLCGRADAQGLFDQFEEQMRRMQQQMQQAFGGGAPLRGPARHEPVRIRATVTTNPADIQVGAPFEFVLALEFPREASVSQVSLTPSETVGLVFTGPAENLTDGESANPSNTVRRLAVPARYDAPYRGNLSFRLQGMVSEQQTRGVGFSFSRSLSFAIDTPPLRVDVKPLPTDGQPTDFSGIVSEGLRVHETCDILTVETNDVVTISYRLMPNGFVPDDYLPEGAAFEWTRQKDREGQVREIEYRRYFVATGERETPPLAISYYDPRTRSYKRAQAGRTPLTYRAPAPHLPPQPASSGK